MNTGDKVICIDNQPCKICKDDTGLILNNVYVIRLVELSPKKAKPHVLLLGFSSKCSHNHDSEMRLSITRFRKLDDMKREAQQTQEAGVRVHTYLSSYFRGKQTPQTDE